MIRSEETEFTYERSSQPQPKIGPWRDEPDRLPAPNAARSSRERLTVIRIFEGEGRARHRFEGRPEPRAGLRGRRRRRAPVRGGLEAPGERDDGGGLRAAQLRARRGAPVRLEPRGGGHRRGRHDREGGACPALPQPDAVRPRRPARDARQMVFDAHDKAFAFFGGAGTRGICDSGHCPPLVREQWTRRRRWTRSSRARSASATAFANVSRTIGVPLAHSSRCAATTSSTRRPLGLNQWRRNGRPCTPASGWGEPCRATGPSDSGERPGREPGRHGPPAVLRAAAAGEELRGAQRLAGRPLQGLGQGASPSGAARHHDPGGVRG